MDGGAVAIRCLQGLVDFRCEHVARLLGGAFPHPLDAGLQASPLSGDACHVDRRFVDQLAGALIADLVAHNNSNGSHYNPMLAEKISGMHESEKTTRRKLVVISDSCMCSVKGGCRHSYSENCGCPYEPDKSAWFTNQALAALFSGEQGELVGTETGR